MRQVNEWRVQTTQNWFVASDELIEPTPDYTLDDWFWTLETELTLQNKKLFTSQISFLASHKENSEYILIAASHVELVYCFNQSYLFSPKMFIRLIDKQFSQKLLQLRPLSSHYNPSRQFSIGRIKRKEEKLPVDFLSLVERKLLSTREHFFIMTKRIGSGMNWKLLLANELESLYGDNLIKSPFVLELTAILISSRTASWRQVEQK